MQASFWSLLLILTFLLPPSLLGQNPLSRETAYRWDTQLRRFDLMQERRFTYDSEGRIVSQTQWALDSLKQLFLSSLAETQYHPGGGTALFENSTYVFPDSLDTYYLARYDEMGYLVQDSFYRNNEQGTALIFARRITNTYRPSGEFASQTLFRWNNQTETYQQEASLDFQYNDEECLTEILTQQNLRFLRQVYERGEDCRVERRVEEVAVSRNGPWQPIEEIKFTYTSFPDSTVLETFFSQWDTLTQDWALRQRTVRVSNLQNQTLRYFSENNSGNLYERQVRYNALGEVSYTRESGTYYEDTVLYSTIYYESEITRISPTEVRIFTKDLLRPVEQQWNQYSWATQIFDSTGRRIKVTQRDSTFNGLDRYTVSEYIEERAHSFYCDGSIATETDFFNGQETRKREYAYRDPVGCPQERISPFEVYPSPVVQWLNVESDALLDERTQLRILDLQGRPVPIQPENGQGLSPRRLLNVRHLPPGYYVLQLVHPNFVQSQKWVKE